MFSQDRGATTSYRTIARGHGGGWARAYRVAQLSQADGNRVSARHGLGDSRIRTGRSQLDVMLSGDDRRRTTA